MICLSCGANLHIENPLRHHILGDGHTFQSWVYLPNADAWESEAFPIFIATGYDDDGSLQTDSYRKLLFEDLTEFEQHIVQTIAHWEDIDTLDTLEQVDYREIWGDLADYLTPFKRAFSSPPEKKVSQVLPEIPRPAVFAAESIYTTDRETFLELFTKPRSETTSQSTLV